MKKNHVILSLVALMALVGCGNKESSVSPSSTKPSSVSTQPEAESSKPSTASSSISSAEQESSLISESSSSIDSTQAPVSSDSSVSSETTESSVAPDSSVMEENYEVILPTAEGFLFTLSKNNPTEGEEVTLFVKNTAPMAKRLDTLSMNGVALTKKNTSEKDTTAYSFLMPSKMNATITVQVVDVFALQVESALQDKIALTGIGEGVFAEGEEVSFKVASYSGYWFKDVLAKDDDVTLGQNADGSYSFTMPNHPVTITATTSDEVYYKVDTSAVDSHITISRLNDLSLYPSGKEVKFSAVADSDYLDSFSLFADGVSISEVSGESGWYSFIMPSNGVRITSTVKYNYRSFTTVNSDHFDIALTTMVKDDQGVEQEIPVTNSNVTKGQTVKVKVTEKDNDDHLYTVKAIEVRHYYNAQYVSGMTATNATYDSDSGSYTFTVASDKYYEIKVVEKFNYLANTTYAGSYKGYRPYYKNFQEAIINQDGTGKIGSDSIEDFTKEKASDPYYTLPIKSSSSYSSSNSKYYAFFHDDLMFAFKKNYLTDSYITRGNAFLFIKDANTFNNTNSRAYYIAKDGTYPNEEFIFIQKEDGTNVGLYVNYGTMSVDFDYTCEVTKGTGIGKDDEVLMKKNGVTMRKLKLNKDATNVDGYEVICTEITADGFEGNYTNDTDSLILDGYGACTLNGEAGTYAITDNKITINIQDVETAYTINKDDHTFSVISEEETPDAPTEVTLTSSQTNCGDYLNWGTYQSGETVIFHMTASQSATDIYFRGDFAKIEIYNASDNQIGTYTKKGTEDYSLSYDLQYGEVWKIVVTFQEKENPSLKVKFEYYSDWGDEY